VIVPPLYDCNVWTGESDDFATGDIDRPNALVGEMDRVGIDRALVYPLVARTENTDAENQRLVDSLDDHPRLTPSWVASPSIVAEHGSPEKFVTAMDGAGVGAVRLFPGEHEFHLTDEWCRSLLEALRQVGAAVVLDCLSATRHDGFTDEELAETCADYQHSAFDHPELSVVLTELVPSMGVFADLEAVVSSVERVGNLYLATGRLQPHDGIRQFVDRCGVDRLLFGSGLPRASAGAGVATVMQSGLTREEQRQVGGENLTRLLGESGRDWGPISRGPARTLETGPGSIVDLHGHVRADAPPDERFPDADGIVAAMDRTGIAIACVSALWDGQAGNDIAARAADRYPRRLVPVAYANPEWPDVRGELKRCFDELDMSMIKIHPGPRDKDIDDGPVDRDRYDPVWEFADDREALVLAHATGSEQQCEAFRRIATNYPEMTLMLYHAGKSWDHVDNFLAVAEACPNVALEITYSYRVDGIIEYLVEQAGADRVYFGTDIGVRAPESQVGWAAYARVTDEERRSVMRDNGLRLLSEIGALPEAAPTD
jgi:predicted TIM-barrel fold metal-dependent hydrolase